MALRFDLSGSIRLDTNLNSHGMGVYGLVRRHTANANPQWMSTIHSSPTSAYTTGSGGPPGEDGQINGIQYQDADALLNSLVEWASGTANLAVADGTWFHFAIVPYLDGGAPRTKIAVRPASGGTTLTAVQTGLFAWSNARIHFGAGNGNGNGARVLLAQLIVRNVSEPSDAQIQSVWASMAMTGATVHASLNCIGAANVAACLVDQSGNSRNFTLSGSNHSVDNSVDPTFNPTISGVGILPSAATITVPDAPTGLSVSVQSATTATLTYTDNADDESEYVAEIRKWNGTAWEAWTVGGSVLANATSIPLSNLDGGAQYEARVRAVNAAGSSTFSNTVSFTMRALYARAYSVQAAAAGVTGCVVQVWRAPTGVGLAGPALVEYTGRSFNAQTAVDPRDGVAKAVMQVPLFPIITEGQIDSLRAGDLVRMYITKPGNPARFTAIIEDAVVVEE